MDKAGKERASRVVAGPGRSDGQRPPKVVVVLGMVTLLACVVAGLFIIRGSTPGAPQVRSDANRGDEASRLWASQNTPPGPEQPAGSESSGENVAGQATGEAGSWHQRATASSSATSAAMAPVREQIITDPATFDTVDPLSVVGRPFPMSGTVAAHCAEELASWGDESPCRSLLEVLDSLAEEPRDPSWAARTEAGIFEYVTGVSGEQVPTIVECRRTLCAVEIESRYEVFPLAYYWQWMRDTDSGLRLVEYVYTVARMPSGEYQHVTLLVIGRR